MILFGIDLYLSKDIEIKNVLKAAMFFSEKNFFTLKEVVLACF